MSSWAVQPNHLHRALTSGYKIPAEMGTCLSKTLRTRAIRKYFKIFFFLYSHVLRPHLPKASLLSATLNTPSAEMCETSPPMTRHLLRQYKLVCHVRRICRHASLDSGINPITTIAYEKPSWIPDSCVSSENSFSDTNHRMADTDANQRYNLLWQRARRPFKKLEMYENTIKSWWGQ